MLKCFRKSFSNTFKPNHLFLPSARQSFRSIALSNCEKAHNYLSPVVVKASFQSIARGNMHKQTIPLRSFLLKPNPHQFFYASIRDTFKFLAKAKSANEFQHSNSLNGKMSFSKKFSLITASYFGRNKIALSEHCQRQLFARRATKNAFCKRAANYHCLKFCAKRSCFGIPLSEHCAWPKGIPSLCEPLNRSNLAKTQQVQITFEHEAAKQFISIFASHFNLRGVAQANVQERRASTTKYCDDLGRSGSSRSDLGWAGTPWDDLGRLGTSWDDMAPSTTIWSSTGYDRRRSGLLCDELGRARIPWTCDDLGWPSLYFALFPDSITSAPSRVLLRNKVVEVFLMSQRDSFVMRHAAAMLRNCALLRNYAIKVCTKG